MTKIINDKISKIEEFIKYEIESLSKCISNNDSTMDYKLSRIRTTFLMLDYEKGKLDTLKALLKDIEIENTKESESKKNEEELR